VKSALEQFPVEERKDAVILFSAHSLPLSVVKWVSQRVLAVEGRSIS
jgi:protoheme ferro-lyase